MSTQKYKFVMLQVVKPRTSMETAIEEMKEAEALVETFGGEVVERSIQHRSDPNPATYIGGGKIEWLSEVVKEKKIDVVVLNDVVRSGQLFRLEQALWPVNRLIKVWDRVGLILSIFDLHAKTREAKLQIELARIKHIGPRVYGLGGTVLSKQGGGIGTRGAGETNIELEQRHIKRRVQQIEKELAQKTRLQQDRMNDRKRSGVQTAALVGYTSAGKTTLFNVLTGREKQENPKLFTTLDSVVGKIKFPEFVKDVIISDTIGFIEGLPPELIQAFRSTLMESVQADTLLHVIDASDPKFAQKIIVVEDILTTLGVKAEPILVFTKIDRIDKAALLAMKTEYKNKKTAFVSSQNQEGIDTLRRLLSAR
ncbi:MAG: GTPase HflX [Candidatus Woesebacteria bacterium]